MNLPPPWSWEAIAPLLSLTLWFFYKEISAWSLTRSGLRRCTTSGTPLTWQMSWICHVIQPHCNACGWLPGNLWRRPCSWEREFSRHCSPRGKSSECGSWPALEWVPGARCELPDSRTVWIHSGNRLRRFRQQGELGSLLIPPPILRGYA